MLSLILGVVLTQEYTLEDRFGKSVDDVLKMGRDAWHEWYTDSSRAGGSTAGESFAQMIFADCLRVKNESHLAVAKGPKEAKIRELEPFFKRTVDNCTDVGRALTGGGTMWNIIHAGCTADNRETVRDLIWPTAKMPQASQKQVWAGIKRTQDLLVKNKSDIESYAAPGSPSFDAAMTSLGSVKADFYSCSQLVVGQDAQFKGRVFAFFRDMLQVTVLGAGEK
jgi:hypothetical protein